MRLLQTGPRRSRTERNGSSFARSVGLPTGTVRASFAIGLLLAVALATRLPAYLGGLHGEQDAARLVVDALAWVKAGVRNEALSEYRYYTSPGYIALVAAILPLHAHFVEVSLAQMLGALNLVLGVAIVVPAYWLAARLTDTGTALLAVLALLFMPTLWHAGSYGFPHLPAVFCLLSAYLVYDRHLTGPPMLGERADVVVVLMLLITGALLKADVHLGAAGLPALLLLRMKATIGRVCVAIALLAIPVLVVALVAQGLLQSSPTVASYLQGYERQYPSTLWHLRSRWHIEGWMMAFGFYTVLVSAVGLVVAATTRRWRLAVVLVACAAPPMIFWFFRPGDSARHHLPEAFPVALGVAIALSALHRVRGAAYLGLAVLVTANHLRYPASDTNFRPSGRVIESADLIRARVAEYHRLAVEYAAVREPRKVFLGTITNPYADGEVLLRSEQVLSVTRTPLLGFDAIQIISRGDGRERFSASVRVLPGQASAAARRFRAEGYVPYAIEYDATGRRATSWRLSALEAD